MNISTTSIGLLLDIIGVIIIYFYGPPIDPILPDGSELVWHGGFGREEDKQKAKEAQRKKLLSKIGLLYIGLGFVFQFIGSLK